MSEPQPVRVWDLPTRTFHWVLAICVVASIVSARIGGGAMVCTSAGYVVLTLLAFRLLWGFVGGHWSRFRAFVYAPATSLRYLRGRSEPHEHHHVGHNPIGAWSVFGLLGIIRCGGDRADRRRRDLQHRSARPLRVDRDQPFGDAWHRSYGQWIIIALIVLHIGAIAFYWFRRRQNLVGPMLHGDKLLTADVPASIDTTKSRVLALALVLACAGAVAWLVGLGS
jgi:cytochrome b